MAAPTGLSLMTTLMLNFARDEIRALIAEHHKWDVNHGLTPVEQVEKMMALTRVFQEKINIIKENNVPEDERDEFKAQVERIFAKEQLALMQSYSDEAEDYEVLARQLKDKKPDRNGSMSRMVKALQLQKISLHRPMALLIEQINRQTEIINDGIKAEMARSGAASTGLPVLTPEQAADKAMAELLMEESKAKQKKPKKKGKGDKADKAGSEVSESVPVAQASDASTQKQKKGRKAVAIAAAAPAPSFDGVTRQRQFDKRLSFEHPLHFRVKRWIKGDLEQIRNEFGPTYANLDDKGLHETLRRHEGGPLARLLGKDNEGVFWWRTENGAGKNSAAMLVQSTRTEENEDNLPLNVLGILNFAFDENNIVFHAYFVPIDSDKLFSYDEIIRGRIGDLEDEMRRMEEDMAVETEAERDLLPEEEWNIVRDRQLVFEKDGSCVCTFKHTGNKMKVIPIGY